MNNNELMSSSNGKNSEADDLYIFSDDESLDEDVMCTGSWKILVVDDEIEVHNLTKLVLSDYRFENRNLKIFSAFSRKEAMEVLESEKDIALVLLDVVMESDDAGLKCVKDIRDVLKNKDVRIVLRTGQPGRAPERNIIMNYDINDYKAKTELTADKIFTMVTSSLRAYRHIMTINKNKIGLENIINASTNIFGLTSFELFANGVLKQLTSILQLDDEAIYANYSSLSAILNENEEHFRVLVGTGEYKEKVGESVCKVLPKDIVKKLMISDENQDAVFTSNSYTGYFKTKKGESQIIYFRWKRDLSEVERELIEIFATNISVAFENISLGNDIINTQKEVIYTLSEAVEGRSRETANHIRRVAELSCLLGEGIGLSEKDIELLKFASAMHDIGKMSTPDSILKKPGKLTDEEYEVMKSHAAIGYNIFSKSSREIMKAAATIAYHHHEKWNGNGYPQGLKGEEIHIYGRIVALADVVDALANARCYKDAWKMEKVIEVVTEERGLHFEPRLVDVLLESLEEYKIIMKKYP